MLPYTCRSFLISTLILFIGCHFELALADPYIVDDWDRTSLHWDGAWSGFSNQPPPTWDGTLTWGNISGSTATFTFTGTSVQVFGAFKPVGTWSMQSQYVIDGGKPKTFLPPQQVQAESYKQKFYDSGALPNGDHTLTITNLGVQLWIDYFLVDDGSGDSTATTASASGNIRVATTVTKTTTRTSSSTVTTGMSSSTHTTRGSTSSSASQKTLTRTSAADNIASSNETKSASSISTSVTPTPLNASSPISSTNTSSTPTTTSPVPLNFPLSSPLSLTSSSRPTTASSPSATAPPRGAEATQAHATAMSRGLIAGITIAGVATLVILLGLGCWFRRRRRCREIVATSPSPYFFSSEGSTHPTNPSDAPRGTCYAASLRSQSSASATLRLSRPPSSIADLVDSYSHSDSDRPEISCRRSLDAGVSLAGGPGVGVGMYGGGGGDAPSISEVQSIKSRLPPMYQAYHAA